ncbi:hypothetical protein [Methanobacterium paludis]|uniref:Uncharacterized protein n=1 Tax=Methanobacterium paludis (strain DSM 25820 / JCM 18151 / SWAN1) TaxID=868131 RepID=F6D616_METPW|nr:hypothetical protein [Methanobacterium paludis]AEG17664.1 hypothetical protein MSWAN_0628 [Methanobacterium paludis]
MKQKASLINLLWIIPIILVYLQHPEYTILAGFGIWVFITSLFEIKNYQNKLYLAINALILAIFLILTYFQLSLPLYSGNKLISYILAILFTLTIIISTYDLTHDYKISKILQMNNTSPLVKDIIAIILLITGLIVGLWLGLYYF